MNKELKNAVEAADAKAQYDECAKRLLGLKSILSYIFAHTIEAFQGMKPKEIIPYIEGEPYIGDVPVEPGLTNAAREQNGQRVTGLNTENREIHEGVAKFDVVTYACLPPEDIEPEDKQTTVIVDVEAQKKDPSEYKILNRAVFYVGRLLSSEKERDFSGSDYDAIKSVYSIWICMNKKENSITRFRFAGEDLVGTGRWKGNCGLMNIIMIGLAKELPPKGDEAYTLHRLLGTLFSEELTVVEKLNILEEEYDIPIEENLEKEVNYMCNLGEGIEERALERGITMGRNEGIVVGEARGIAVGEARGEAAIVKRMNKNGFTAEQIATATDKDVEEVEAILAGGEPVLA